MKLLIAVIIFCAQLFCQKISLNGSLFDKLEEERYIRAGEFSFIPFRSACFFPWVEARELTIIYDVKDSALEIEGSIRQTNGKGYYIPYGKILVGINSSKKVEMPDLRIGEKSVQRSGCEVNGVNLDRCSVMYADSLGKFKTRILIEKDMVINFDFNDNTTCKMNVATKDRNEDEVYYVLSWTQLIDIGKIPEMYEKSELSEFIIGEIK